MSNIDIIRAWKDEEYRNSLTKKQRSQLPDNPAGMIELSDNAMENVKGGIAAGYTGCVCPGTVKYTCGIVCIRPTKSFEQCATPPIVISTSKVSCA